MFATNMQSVVLYFLMLYHFSTPNSFRVHITVKCGAVMYVRGVILLSIL